MNPKKKKSNNTDEMRKCQRLHRDLNKLDFPLKEDGHFGKETKKSVLEFQRRHNIEPTGMVDEWTAEMISIKVRSVSSAATCSFTRCRGGILS
ncbi:MAG: peptidoglycan-binding domain-containing protein [Candidatus Methanoperedens sp.]|nr:peptidoglycan-binding domain-containing protein [Candidatus Methanoperedens sp.]